MLSDVIALCAFMRHRGIPLDQSFFQGSVLMTRLAARGAGPVALIGSVRDLGFWRTPLKTRQMRSASGRYHGCNANQRAFAQHRDRIDRIPLGRAEIACNGVDPDFELTPDCNRRAATATGGKVELVRDGETGRLASVADAPALSSAIADLLADEPLRKSMGADARNAALHEYWLERSIARHQEPHARWTAATLQQRPGHHS